MPLSLSTFLPMGAAILELLARRVLKGKSSKAKAPIGFLISDSGEIGNMIQDFPERGVPTPEVGVPSYYTAIFLRNIKKKENGTRGRTPLAPPPLDLPMLQASLLLNPPVYYI